jgi:nucleotide-binding universal stress UspA family protein
VDVDEIGTVVVGIDGTPGSRPVLEHALHDAARRGARLRVVAVVPLPEYWVATYGMGVVPPSAEVVAEMRADAQGMVDEVVAAHAGLLTRVPVSVVAVVGAPAEVLLAEAQDADLLMLGDRDRDRDRGRGALARAVLGSVGLHCVLHAACAVTIVRPVPEYALPAVGVGYAAVPA